MVAARHCSSVLESERGVQGDRQRRTSQRMSAVRDIESLPGDLAALDRLLAHALRDATHEVTRAVFVKARYEHSWQARTGETDNQILYAIADVGAGTEGVVASTSPLTFILNDGSRAHLIWPQAAHGTAKKNMQWGQKAGKRGGTPRAALKIPVAGGFIFRPYVQHPGTAPTRFMDDAADLADEMIDGIVDKHIERAFDAW
jgi:hypothetical protein